MSRPKGSVVASVVVLGIILAIASTEMEDSSYTVGYIGHRNEESSTRPTTTTNTTERCLGKLGIEVTPQAPSENATEMDATNYPICEWKNATETSSPKLAEDQSLEAKRLDDSISSSSPETTTAMSEGDNDSITTQFVFEHKQRLTTSQAITQRGRSARLISSFNSSETTTRTPMETSTNTNTEETLELPLIVPSRRELLEPKQREKAADINDKQRYLKKDHLKASINLVDGKANKIFYEIKPSLNTALDDNDDAEQTSFPIVTNSRRHFVSGFKLPSVPSSFGKFGPYFLDEVDRRNVTERIGSTVMLDCRIGLLGDKKVTWLQHEKDTIRLLTVGNVQYSADERISLKFQYPDNWRLQIAYATLRDSGLYKCQVEIDPLHSLVKRYNVFITAPILNITDDSGRVISGERHLKAGSALKLRCEGRDILERLNESLLWTRGDETLSTNVSENRTSETVGEKESPMIVSTLTVERATPRDAGNYSCIVPERAKTTIAVHVLNGELPAAVHHGNGVSGAMLNLWLIHLTASCGIFR